MTDVGAPIEERTARRLFGDAVLAFSVDPGPDNLVRYLAASRALEEARRARAMPPQPHPRAKSSRPAARGARMSPLLLVAIVVALLMWVKLARFLRRRALRMPILRVEKRRSPLPRLSMERPAFDVNVRTVHRHRQVPSAAR